jgi:hypothetical protein
MTASTLLPHLTALTVGIQLTRSGHTSEKNSHVRSNGSIKTHNLSSFFCVDVKFLLHQMGKLIRTKDWWIFNVDD